MNVIVPLFAEYIANDLIVPLGEGEDQYFPQQSIRTFVNTTNRDKYHVKASHEYIKYPCIQRASK